MSTLCGLLAVSASLISNPRLGQSKWPLITSLTTGLLSFLAILLFSLSVVNQINLSEEDHAPFRYGLSFSFVGGCIGCILFCISGLLFVLIKIKESVVIFPMDPARPEKKKQSRVTEKKL
uniref:Uncharacterized protein n=1 Tax=Sphaerodactylus townsendi TaxID=933632 RepID=A0ACB8FRL4_9SAUR